MMTLRYNTIGDLPLVSRRDINEAKGDAETEKVSVTERFLTIWDNPRLRRAKARANQRAPRKLPRFYM